jgi:hypothetical protein
MATGLLVGVCSLDGFDMIDDSYVILEAMDVAHTIIILEFVHRRKGPYPGNIF